MPDLKICPKCGYKNPPYRVKCKNCDEALSDAPPTKQTAPGKAIQTWIKQANLFGEGRPIEQPKSVKSVDTPNGYRVEELGQNLRITFVERFWLAIGIMLFNGVGFVILGAIFVSHSGDLAAAPWALILLLGGIPFFYIGLVLLINRTEILVTSGTLSVRSWPLPSMGNKSLDRTQVTQLFVTRIENGRGSETYPLFVSLKDGRKVMLTGEILEKRRAEFLERQLERWLGIQNQAVED